MYIGPLIEEFFYHPGGDCSSGAQHYSVGSELLGFTWVFDPLGIRGKSHFSNPRTHVQEGQDVLAGEVDASSNTGAILLEGHGVYI
jgi:hypothetical protein